MRPLYFTICARNYLAYALTLRASLLRVAPDADFRIFLSDEPGDTPSQFDFVIPAKALNIQNFSDMSFRYDVLELSTAIKPHCFLYAFDELHAKAAVYLDPDIHVFAPLSEVEDALASCASCVLTPHLLNPLVDAHKPTNLDILTSGSFNLGFAAFADCGEARNFLDWWGRTLETDGYVALERGLFVDQKWMDFAPSFLRQLKVLSHPGYNVAYWNLGERLIHEENGMWMSGNLPLVFFHFSGVIPEQQDVFSKHQNRFDMETAGPAAKLVRDYLEHLAENGHANWSRTLYAYGQFIDGTPILKPMRRAPCVSSDPFLKPDLAYWNAPSPDVDQPRGRAITRLMMGIYAMRPDLQEKFPLSAAWGRTGFHNWFIAFADQEYSLSPESMAAASVRGPFTFLRLDRWIAKLRVRLSQR